MGLLNKIIRKDQKKSPSKDSASAHATADRENVLPASPKTASRGGNMVKEEQPNKPTQPLKEDTGTAHRILKSGHLSEKSNFLSTIGKYIFKVDKVANKIEIAKAVEKAYDVKVVSVNIINSKGKYRRMGRVQGRTSDWKKAIVTLKAGQKISGLIEGV